MPATLEQIRAIWSGPQLISDFEFDRIYDQRVRDLSDRHWTPVDIAARAARLLVQGGASRILDVGSGVGKFCIVGALTTEASFVGIERRADLVDVARYAALRLGAERATFVRGDVDTFSFEGFDGLYLYNPFYEQVARYLGVIDDTIEGTTDAFQYFVAAIEEKLEALAAPVAVVTFHGFGGNMPRSFTLRADEPAGNDRLELWTKE